MNTLPLFVIGILFIIINIYWSNKLYQKKVELEEEERALLQVGVGLDLYDRLDSILENINDGLDEWQSVERVHCPCELESFKIAQEEIKELIHDFEVSL
jgi:hypothetical protein